MIELSTASETDSHGVFVLNRESRDEVGVIWVTAGGYSSAWMWAPADGKATEMANLVLAQEDGQGVKVVRSDGGSVEGASVFQRGSLGRVLPSGSFSRDAVALQLYVRKMVAPEGGLLRFPAWSSRRVYSAELEDLCSADVVGAGEPVVLELKDSVVASGIVRASELGASIEGALLYVYLENEQENSETLAFVRAVPASGRFEGMHWPWNPLGGYRLVVEGAGLALGEAHVLPVRAGSAIRFEVVCGEAHTVTLHFARTVEDDAGGGFMEVSGVSTWVTWLDEERGAYLDADLRYASDENGLATVMNCPSGLVAFRYEAEGFVPGVTALMLVEEENSEPLEVRLEPSGRLEVRVIYGGEPVDDFTVYYWPQGSDPSIASTRRLRANEDHVAVLDHIPLGDLSILAKAPGVPQCQPQVVTLEAGGVSDVTLELPNGVVGVGRVLDGVTREPVEGAEVSLTVGQAGTAFAYSEDIAKVAPDGTFRLTSFPPSISSIVVFAPGYSPLPSLADLGAEGTLDFGTLFLTRAQPLVIRCSSRTPIAWEECLGSVTGGAYAPTAPLSADGVFVCEEGQHGEVTFQLTLPTGETIARAWSLFGAGPWERRLVLEGTASLTVELVGEGSGLPATLEVRLSTGEGVDTYMTTYLPLEEGSSTARFEALDAGFYTLSCYDSDWNTLATRSVNVGDGELEEVDLRLDGQPFSIRIIDSQGNAVVGAVVELRDVKNASSQLQGSVTGPEGIAHFAPTVVSDFFVNVSHPTGGFLPPRRVSRPRTRDPIDIVWGDTEGLVAYVFDGGVPLEGLELWIHELESGVPAVTFSVPTSGHFERSNIGAGDYFAEPHSAWVWNRRVPFRLDIDGTPVRLEFRRLGDLTVSVEDLLGNPVEGVAVELVSDEFGESVAGWLAEGRVVSGTGLVTDGEGMVRLGGLPHGVYSWFVGGKAGSVDVAVGTGSSLEVQLGE